MMSRKSLLTGLELRDFFLAGEDRLFQRLSRRIERMTAAELRTFVTEWAGRYPEGVRQFLQESLMAFLLLHESSIPVQRPETIPARRAA